MPTGIDAYEGVQQPEDRLENAWVYEKLLMVPVQSERRFVK